MIAVPLQPRMDPEVLAIAEATLDPQTPPVILAQSRPRLRREYCLRRFYDEWVRSEYQRRVARGTLSSATIQKDRQALTRWECLTRPADWPAEKPWPGWPMEFITAPVLDAFLAKLHTDFPPGTARSTWSHVRHILNQAARVRLYEEPPRPTVIPWENKTETPTFSESEIGTVYGALRDSIDLQVAFVVALCAGLRPSDLFLLRWADVPIDGIRPTITYRARMTKQILTVPLAKNTVRQLARLPSRGTSPLLFPGRSSPEAKDPEKSRPARARREWIAARLTAAGLGKFDRPFQSARATCFARLESHVWGSGQFVLGHYVALNSTSRVLPSDMVFEAVESVPQPPCFLLD